MVADSPSTMDSEPPGKRCRNSRTTGSGQVPRHRRRQADDDVADRRILGLVDLAPRPVDLLQDAARVLEQALARLGRRGAPPVAQQQVLPQLDFEAADLPADRGLGDAEQRARRG